MVKTTYITYAELLSLVAPYFRMAGGEDLLASGELSMLINLAIQDLINNSSFSFMSEFQKINKNEELYQDTYSVFECDYPINRVHELLIEGDGDVNGEMVDRMPYFNSNEFFFKRGTNILYGPKDCEYITLNYEKEFVKNSMSSNEDLQKILPIPFTFVPALIKMIYDNGSIFTFFQGEGASADYYGHGKTRMNDLVESDMLSSKTKIGIGQEQ